MPAIRLELFEERHLATFGVLLTDPDVQRFTRVPVPTPPDFARTWLASYESGRCEGRKEAFAIVDDHDESFLGVGVAPKIDHEASTVELGYVVVPTARGRGVATAALGLLTGWALGELGAMRLELLISLDNVASKRVAERCGYVREGILRSLYFKPGVREDTEIWSRLATDP